MLIPISTCYNPCCSIPFHVILFAYRIIWNILSALPTHLSFPWSLLWIHYVLIQNRVSEILYPLTLSSSCSTDHLRAHRHLYHVKPFVFVLLLKPLCLFCCSLFCHCGVIAYVSPSFPTDLLGVWRIELTGRESEELHRTEKASYTLVIPSPIFSTYAFSKYHLMHVRLSLLLLMQTC